MAAKKKTRASSVSRRKSSFEGIDLQDSWWDRLSDTQQHLIILAFFVVLSLAFFWPVHFGGKALVGSDIVQWRGMAQAMLEYREATGEEPLWAPHAFGGMPGYLISYPNLVPQVDTLLGWLRQWLWPSSHFIFLLIGAYWLVFFLTRDKLAGVLSACAYGLTTYIPVILIAGHNTKFVALTFAPYLVLAFAYVLANPGVLSALLFAIAAAVNIRAGHIQITYYASFLIAIWWLIEGIGYIREKKIRLFLQATGWLLLGSLLALLMVAQPYLAIWEYKSFTIRGAGSGSGGLGWDYAMRWSQGISEVLTLLIPGAFGGSSQELYWGPKPFTAGPHYVGGIVLALALIAVGRVRRRPVTAFAVATLVMLLFAFGRHAAWINRLMFEHFPLFNAFRAPETWMVMVAFALAVLAGFGLWYLAKYTQDALEEKGKLVWASFGGLAAMVVLLLLVKGAVFSFEQAGEFERYAQAIAQQNRVSLEDPRVARTAERVLEELREKRMDRFTQDALRTLLFLALGGGVFWLYQQRKLKAAYMQMLMILLVVVDLWGVDRRYFNPEVLPSAARAERLVPEYGFDRWIKARVKEAGGPGHFRVLPLALNPLNNAQPSYHYESIGGYHGAKLRDYQQFVERMLFAQGMNQPDPKALDLFNVRYIVARAPLPGTEVVYRDEQTGLLVLENPDYLPRAYLVGRYTVVSSLDSMLLKIQAPDFDPRKEVILMESPPIEPVPVDSHSVAEVTLKTFSPREIVFRVRTDAPQLLVISEVYYPAGWKAYVDGEEAPIYRANYLFRAVPVPAGEHTVTLRFEPESHRIGLIISWITTLLVYGTVLSIIGVSYLKKRKKS